MSNQTADWLIRAGAIHSMAPDDAVYRAIAVLDERIVGLAVDPSGLDGLITSGTRVIEAPSLTLLPAFVDTHNHLLEATNNRSLVPVGNARSLAAFMDLIRARAAVTPPGRWIQTANSWHEQNLAEKRLPTARELDEATSDHPVLVRRGGHMAVVNSLGLRLAGLTEATTDPPGGRLGRFPDGSLNGVLEGGAQYQFIQEAYRAGRLPLRCRPMLLVLPSGSVVERVSQVEGFAGGSGAGDDWLRMWGLKFVLDGGPEGGALDQPYANDPSFNGHLNWDPDEMLEVMHAGVRKGWRIGTHAIGDRAVRTVLDVYERLVRVTPDLPRGTLVVEHAFLANANQRVRAIRLGVAITVQPALLYALGESLVTLWGPERTRNVMPVNSWIEEGAQVSSGTDYPIGFFEPIRTVWGLVTRQTERVSVQGPEHAVDRHTALYLSTAADAQLHRDSDRSGSLEPGKLADIVAFRTDPLACPADALPGLRPVLTVVGGRAAYDPEGLLPQPIATAREHDGGRL